MAGGKGVFVFHEKSQLEGAKAYFESKKIIKDNFIVEECLVGKECSYFSMIGHQNRYVPLGFAVDFKRLLNEDKGPNTGGMGCYSPVPWLPSNARKLVEDQVITPLLNELTKQNNPYLGFLYVGLMWTSKGPKVIEFNCRMGDPETQVMVRHKGQDWGEYLKYAMFAKPYIKKENSQRGYAQAVVLASDGYPYLKANHQHRITNLSNENTKIFWAGAEKPLFSVNLETTSGRLLTISSHSEDPETACQASYQIAQKMHDIMPGTQFRSDIKFHFSKVKNH